MKKLRNITNIKRDLHWRLSALTGVLLLSPMVLCLWFVTPLHAQESEENGVENTEQESEESIENSQSVDQVEENFRRRMELRDQRFRQRPRANMTYTPSTGNEKLDMLPEASQQHIKEQMREMIISSRQWQPGEDLSDYPYEASPDAREDARLHENEREAWVEQLQKYQQREAAAYAASQNAGQNQQNGQQEGQQQGQQGNQQNSSEQSQSQQQMAHSESQNQNQSSQQSQSSAASDPSQSSEEISTEGVSESALAFLQGSGGGSQSPTAAPPSLQQGQEGQSEESDSQATESAAESAAEPPPGTLALEELAMLQGMSGASQTLNLPELPSSESSSADSNSANDSGESPENPAEALNLDGTLLIGELRNLNQAGGSSAGIGAGSSALLVPVSSEEPSSDEP